ncbi:hypothetical protein [Nonlabens sp.]|uniref:hypothetical protein n=1 Tax=Nonlabens sp. TaxID=1888209 RepID=UPI003F6A420E
MRYFILVLSFSCSFFAVAQKRIPVDLVFEYNDELTYFEKIWIGHPDLDRTTTLEAMQEGYRPDRGFQYISWYDYKAPVHLEENDFFTVVLGEKFDSYNYYYTGDKAAVKNNYVLDRYRALLDLEQDTMFINADRLKSLKLIAMRKDSLLSMAKSLSLTETFLKDEKKYWKYYEAYQDVFHEVLRNYNLGINSLSLDDFPQLDYDFEEDHVNYRTYLNLSIAFYFHKLLSISDYKEMRDVVKAIDSKVLRWKLVTVLKYAVLKRHEKSDDFFKLIKRFSYSPFHDREVKIIYNSRNRLSVGDPFPELSVSDFYDKKIDLQKARGKAAYVLLYPVNDKNLEANFLLWNQFFLDRKNENARFMTIGLGTDQFKSLFKNYFLENQVAGSHLSTSHKKANQLLENLSIGVGPVIIQLDKDWSIIDFNSFSELIQFPMFSNHPSPKSWSPNLGDRP